MEPERSNDRESHASGPAPCPVVTEDPAGAERALQKAAMPANLLIPIAAASREALLAHVGRDITDLARTKHGNALLVLSECGPERSNLNVWSHTKASVLNAERQLWVRPSYRGYRRAYRLSFPEEQIDGLVIHHIMNRRYAAAHGFEYVRVIPISRSSNSSSGFSENWGVELTREGILRSRKSTEQIGYADLAHRKRSFPCALTWPFCRGRVQTAAPDQALVVFGKLKGSRSFMSASAARCGNSVRTWRNQANGSTPQARQVNIRL